jgi:hypothetical protein
MIDTLKPLYAGAFYTTRTSGMMQEAARLAADGELGNSDAIRLLQIPHCSDDVKAVLEQFGEELTPEARSKLTREALVPLPPGIDNQRYEPLFDKYRVSGDLYRTASGCEVPGELQYYNGEMAHLYGECDNLAMVDRALAGSGYRALTLTYPDGRETAVAQVWATRFTDSTLGPYNAMFIVVAAISDSSSAIASSLHADANGASSAIPMLFGSFDASTAVHENAARLFMVRLLDTTQVAIDVGRERMGTDKRAGKIDLARDGRRLRWSIADGGGRSVLSADLELSDMAAAYGVELDRAARTAGVALRPFARGTEYSFPAVARIDRGPLVHWQWRTDVAPRLQAIQPQTVVIDARSEEGALLQSWRFVPKVLAYVPNIRGVVTGLSNEKSSQSTADAGRRSADRSSMSRPDLIAPAPTAPYLNPLLAQRRAIAVEQRARDGSVMLWGTPETLAPAATVERGAAVPIVVAVSPVRPGHVVSVEYRVGSGPVRQVTALPDLRPAGGGARLFRGIIPGQSSGPVEFLPVLRHAGQPISPRLDESRERLRYEVRSREGLADKGDSSSDEASPSAVQAQWKWNARYLGSLKARLRKETVGETPDGLRLDWYVVEGRFVGPNVDLVALPGAADWMRVRRDGMGVVDVRACFETRDGTARIYGSYGGLFDLGPAGYERALREEYDPLPPVVVTPTYATAAPKFAWLNRVQCIGVGRVDMSQFLVEFDVYVIDVDGASEHRQGRAKVE